MSQRMRDAIWSGDVAAIDVLIAEGEDPSAIDRNNQWSGLMLAAENHQRGSMIRLLAAGVDPNSAMEDGWTALHHAVDSECDAEAQTGEPADGRLVALLIESGADPNAVWTTPTRPETPCDMATRFGCKAVMSILDR